jgi:hypothetical protein
LFHQTSRQQHTVSGSSQFNEEQGKIPSQTQCRIQLCFTKQAVKHHTALGSSQFNEEQGKIPSQTQCHIKLCFTKQAVNNTPFQGQASSMKKKARSKNLVSYPTLCTQTSRQQHTVSGSSKFNEEESKIQKFGVVSNFV